MKRSWLTSLVIASLALAVASCGGDDDASPRTTTTSTGVATTNVPAATTTTLALIEYPSGATYLTGRIDEFQIDEGTVETDANGVQHTRDGTINYRLVSSDPRVTGTVNGSWNTDRWGDIDGGVMIQWGEATLANAHGAWEATYQGAFASPVGDILTRWWRGSGDYEGLTFFMWIAGSEVGSPYFDWGGIIVPGDPPPGAG